MKWKPNECAQNSRHRIQKPTHKSYSSGCSLLCKIIKWLLNLLSILFVQWNDIPVTFSFIFMWPQKSLVSNLSVKIKFDLEYLRKEIISYNFYEVYPKFPLVTLVGSKSIPQKDRSTWNL